MLLLPRCGDISTDYRTQISAKPINAECFNEMNCAQEIVSTVSIAERLQVIPS